MTRQIAAICAALALSGCAVLKPDFTDLRGVKVPAGDLTPHPIPITFSAFEDFGRLQYVCNLADKRNQASGLLKGYTACAIVHPKGCALAFWVHTSYEHIGHEVVHCFEPWMSDAVRAQMPIHFQQLKPWEPLQ